MSYDYDGIVTSIVTNRKLAYNHHNDDDRYENGTASTVEEYLQKSVDSFTKFSQECPMTPMLWMQYAWDSSVMVRSLLNPTTTTEMMADKEDVEIQKQCLEMLNSILTMALTEFPGCALLWRMYLEGLLQQHLITNTNNQNSNDSTTTKQEEEEVEEAFHNAIHQVGRGSHRNQDDCHVAAIYRLRVTYYFFRKRKMSNHTSPSWKEKVDEKIRMTLFQRASTPMNHANDSLFDELRLSMEEYNHPDFLTSEDFTIMEERKRFASKYFDILSRSEMNLTAAMDQEGITLTSSLLQYEKKDGFLDWQELLKPNDDAHYLMGLGMLESAKAFVNYANQLWNFEKHERKKRKESKRNEDDSADDESDEDEEERMEALNIVSSLATSVYERGISECPTVELIWEKYIKHLLYLIQQNDNDKNKQGMIIAQLKNVCQRAVRNCPYSVSLFKHKLQVLDLESETVFDPDHAMEIVKEAITVGFLPDSRSQLEIYMSAIQLVKSRLLQLITKATTRKGGNSINFDDVYMDDKVRGKKKKRTISNNNGPIELFNLDDDSKQDAFDLVDDLREMYDTTDSFLRKNHAKWTKGRALLLYDRAQTEAYILTPFSRYANNGVNDETENDEVDPAISCFEKLVRVHQPPHPDSWLSYINYIFGRASNHYSKVNHNNDDNDDDDNNDELLENPAITTLKIRHVRGLYQKSLSTVKKQQESKEDADDLRNYDFALCNLCHSYLQFEKTFGSTKSYQTARKLTSGKLTATTTDTISPPVITGTTLTEDINQPLDEENKHTIENKRKLSNDNADNDGEQNESEPIPKKPKTSKESEIIAEPLKDVIMGDTTPPDDPTNTTGVEKKTNLKIPKLYPEYKIKVGKLEYPAHPFTIHVSNLSQETQDMDLVDLFQEKCGKLVHARIFRDKSKSKGCGLVQFEERDSVDNALELDGVVGLHEKLINIRRSHIPAVSIVPSGMHRVKPKGEGKVSKRNMRRKEKLDNTEKDHDSKRNNIEMKKSMEKDKEVKPTNGNKNPYAALAFRPRAVRGNNDNSRKPSMTIEEKK